MIIKFNPWNKAYKQNKEQTEAYSSMLDKVLNENLVSLHRMLMKSDVETFLANHKTVITESLLDECADLSDLSSYEKELSKYSGDETR